jgi:hypothetical protein
MRAECYAVDGEIELLLDDLTPWPPVSERRQSEREAGTDVGAAGDAGSFRPEDRIESQPVRALLGLFISGVDGLDGRVRATESEEGISLTLGGRTLAEVGVSQGSFTVTPGDSLVNPIVVSDRVSLERALNAVVSLFVREDVSAHDGGSSGPELDDAEQAQLAEIWGRGISADA